MSRPVLSVLLGIAALASATAGVVLAAHIASPPACFEACFLDQLVPGTFAVIFGISAIVNLAMLSTAIARRAALTRVLLAQGSLLLAVVIWLVGLVVAASPLVSLAVLGALGIVAASIVVCVQIGLAIIRSHPGYK